MKLPTDPKERNQMFVLIGIVAVAICVGIYFGFQSLADAKKGMVVSLEAMESSLTKADAKIRRMSIDKADNDKALKEILDVSENYVLTSVLGNYQLVARDMIESVAKELELSMEPLRELGQVTFPYSGKTGVFNGYVARVSLNCGMHDLLRFLHRLETANPYLCITGISIVERHNQNRDLHQISFEVQWPIWADSEVRDAMIERSNVSGQEEGGAE